MSRSSLTDDPLRGRLLPENLLRGVLTTSHGAVSTMETHLDDHEEQLRGIMKTTERPHTLDRTSTP